MEENKNMGWISLHRSMLEWEWYTDTSAKSLFIHLLLIVNYEDKKYKGRIIRRGCIRTNLEKLARGSGLGVKTVCRVLDDLEKSGEITVVSIPNKGTEICVNNFNNYQNPNSESGNNARDNARDYGNDYSNDYGTNEHNLEHNHEQRLNKTNKTNKSSSSKKNKKSSSASDDAGEFNSIPNMKAIQQIECQTRWNKILKVWITTENTPALTQAYKKFEKLGTEHQEEIVQFIESIPANKRPFLKNLWISTYLKGNLFHPGIIERDLEKYVTLAGNPKTRSEQPGVILRNQPLDEYGNRRTN